MDQGTAVVKINEVDSIKRDNSTVLSFTLGALMEFTAGKIRVWCLSH